MKANLRAIGKEIKKAKEISGAGIPKELPEYVKVSNTKIAPIVSSLKCCKLIVTHWMKNIIMYQT